MSRRKRFERLGRCASPIVSVDISGLIAHLDAMTVGHLVGRLFSIIPSRKPPEPDPYPTSPGAGLLETMRATRKGLEAEPEWAKEQCERSS
jgi:hypothetical protein